MPTLKEFLYQAGVNKDTPSDKVQSLKKQYSKAYQNGINLNEKRHSPIYLTVFQSGIFRAKANGCQIRPNRFANHSKKGQVGSFHQKAVLTYLSNQYLPRDEMLVRALGKDIRAIGNNINQVIQSVHRARRKTNFPGLLAMMNSIPSTPTILLYRALLATLRTG